ncbi:type II toxin-antitoxin system RelE/ParE family toxin [Chitinophaga cymbidii]|uniref:Killer suppression protein HigA n=1 Tax=Chitinophaga cymbidii TaxID=1096750 RepID=A0A512RNZ3_9BACT|nr:type II toxin-antitoxin system RelE/ParE family toxin [Chitinophaga cymbidii]GEP97404.1 killer suppression protein HigA [Chitinophaga cymbidii]
MNITFADRKLGKLITNDRRLDQALGKIRADKLRLRLAQLQAAETLEDVRYLAGGYHQLKNDRKGQWACDLDQPYRLVFKPHEDPIPMNDNGQCTWIEITGVEVLEIVNYHKEK